MFNTAFIGSRKIIIKRNLSIMKDYCLFIIIMFLGSMFFFITLKGSLYFWKDCPFASQTNVFTLTLDPLLIKVIAMNKWKLMPYLLTNALIFISPVMNAI